MDRWKTGWAMEIGDRRGKASSILLPHGAEQANVTVFPVNCGACDCECQNVCEIMRAFLLIKRGRRFWCDPGEYVHIFK